MSNAPEPLYVETYGDRLHKAMKVAGLDAKSLAEKAGIHRNSVSSYLADRTVPSKGHNQLLAWATDAPAVWLATGVRPDSPDGGVDLPGRPTDRCSARVVALRPRLHLAPTG